MKQTELCFGQGVPVNPQDRLTISNPIHYPERINWDDTWHDNVRQRGVKRIRLKCTTCGRKLWASLRTCHDGCCIYFSLPKHKPRGWWKRKSLRRTKGK